MYCTAIPKFLHKNQGSRYNYFNTPFSISTFAPDGQTLRSDGKTKNDPST